MEQRHVVLGHQALSTPRHARVPAVQQRHERVEAEETTGLNIGTPDLDLVNKKSRLAEQEQNFSGFALSRVERHKTTPKLTFPSSHLVLRVRHFKIR